MSSDLLEARASINWAVAQLEPLTTRIEAWCNAGPYELITDFDSERAKNAIKYEIACPVPLLINAEVGAIINSIRSSLDLLAVVLARRNGQTSVKDVSFPICGSEKTFTDHGLKKIKHLSTQDRSAIAGLRPYKGGDDLLYALHQMDITRKHRNLLTVHTNLHFSLSGSELQVEWPHELPVGERRPEHKFVLAWVSAGAPDYNATLSVEITLARTKPLQPESVVPALREFAGLAHSVIARFE